MSLLSLAHLADNAFCADCHAAAPDWASINLGVFVCIKCAGIHRTLGSHISKIRSVALDIKCWDPELVTFMESVGNVTARGIYEKYCPAYFLRPSQDATDDIREHWIRCKYEKRIFCEQEAPAAHNQNQLQHHQHHHHHHHQQQQHPVGCVTLMPQKARHGFMQKLSGSGGRWQLRWFVLNGPFLSYYRSATDSFQANTIHVAGASIEVPATTQRDCLERPSAIKVCVEGRDFHFVPPDTADMIEWVHALRRASIFYANLNDHDANAASRNHVVDMRPSWKTLTCDVWRGYLVKQGGKLKTWHKRYFVLVGGDNPLMYYFKNMPEGHDCRPEGAIPVLNAAVASAEDRTNKEFIFSITTYERQYLLQAFSREDFCTWLDKLDQVIEASTLRRPINFMNYESE